MASENSEVSPNQVQRAGERQSRVLPEYFSQSSVAEGSSQQNNVNTRTIQTSSNNINGGTGSQVTSPSLSPIRSTGSGPSNQDTATVARSDSLPPPYSEAPPPRGVNQGIFMPYITQELPNYSEFGSSIPQRQLGEIQLGFMRQSGGQCVPIQIPGYISTGNEGSSAVNSVGPPLLSHRNNNRQQQPHQPSLSNTAPRRQRDTEVPIFAPNDYFKCTFTMLVMCTLLLNLPAILILMVALLFSVKVKERQSNRDYTKSKKYSTAVLICNYLALLEFFVILLCGFALILIVFVFGIRFV